jgi:hypothetical protein
MTWSEANDWYSEDDPDLDGDDDGEPWVKQWVDDVPYYVDGVKYMNGQKWSLVMERGCYMQWAYDIVTGRLDERAKFMEDYGSVTPEELIGRHARFSIREGLPGIFAKVSNGADPQVFLDTYINRLDKENVPEPVPA